MCLYPWNSPSQPERLLREVEAEFNITRYRDKTKFFYRPERFRNAFRNFQWVTTENVSIARCAQPGYRGSDKIHDFSNKQLNFLRDNNIKTIFSFNSKHLRFGSKLMLDGMNIQHTHIKTEDFKAITTKDHEDIDRIIRERRNFGGVLFYCGYGAGRTGTAVAGYMLKTILLREPDFLFDLPSEKLVYLLQEGFGIEKQAQAKSVADYLRSLVTVAPAVPGGRQRSLSEVSNATFVDVPDNLSQASFRSIPPLPPAVTNTDATPASGGGTFRPAPRPRDGKTPAPPAYYYSGQTRPPPPLPGNKPPPHNYGHNVIPLQSIDTIGKLRNSLVDEFEGAPSLRRSRGSSVFSKRFLSSEGHRNPDSFYLNRVSF